MLEDLLLNWYDSHRRIFPWRERIFTNQDEHAYHTWICEVMSQQTLLSVLLPKYMHFLSELPNIEALYHCSEEKLRSLWKGLGYYARARNLQKGAQYIIQDCNRVFPKKQTEWKSVPGCGDYTAAIIASICYKERVAAVDGNAIRVVSRLLNLQDTSVWTQKGQKKIFSFLQKHIPDQRPGDFNQAIMDLGATICKKHEAKCLQCPIQKYCRAYETNTVSLCPPIKPRAEKINKELYILIMRYAQNKKQIGILKRSNGFLKNTTGFPIYIPDKILKLERVINCDKENDLKIRFLNKKFKHSITNHNITGSIVCIDFCDKINHDSKDEFDAKLRAQDLLKKLDIHNPVHWYDQAVLKDLLSSSLDQKAYKILLSME